MRIAIAISNVEQLEATWTTVLLVHEALEAGHSVTIFEPRDFEVTARAKLYGRASVLEPPSPGVASLAEILPQRRLARRYVELRRCDALLLRVNPLTEHVLNLALMVQEQGVAVLNDP